MYAVIVTGGKQYRVAQGETLRVEKLEGDVGAALNFDQILLVGSGEGISVGAPLVGGASVAAKIVSHGRLDKIRIIKFRRRKHHQKQMGHRQYYTEIEITGITGASDKKKSDSKAKE
jgi:large subunit ribosomal protein L21